MNSACTRCCVAAICVLNRDVQDKKDWHNIYSEVQQVFCMRCGATFAWVGHRPAPAKPIPKNCPELEHAIHVGHRGSACDMCRGKDLKKEVIPNAEAKPETEEALVPPVRKA